MARTSSVLYLFVSLYSFRYDDFMILEGAPSAPSAEESESSSERREFDPEEVLSPDFLQQIDALAEQELEKEFSSPPDYKAGVMAMMNTIDRPMTVSDTLREELQEKLQSYRDERERKIQSAQGPVGSRNVEHLTYLPAGQKSLMVNMMDAGMDPEITDVDQAALMKELDTWRERLRDAEERGSKTEAETNTLNLMSHVSRLNRLGLLQETAQPLTNEEKDRMKETVHSQPTEGSGSVHDYARLAEAGINPEVSDTLWEKWNRELTEMQNEGKALEAAVRAAELKVIAEGTQLPE